MLVAVYAGYTTCWCSVDIPLSHLGLKVYSSTAGGFLPWFIYYVYTFVVV